MGYPFCCRYFQHFYPEADFGGKNVVLQNCAISIYVYIKVECMFVCCCSKETLNSGASAGCKKVNISAAVGARIQETSHR